MTGQKGHKALASKKSEKKTKLKENVSPPGICRQFQNTKMVDESIRRNLCFLTSVMNCLMSHVVTRMVSSLKILFE